MAAVLADTAIVLAVVAMVTGRWAAGAASLVYAWWMMLRALRLAGLLSAIRSAADDLTRR